MNLDMLVGLLPEHLLLAGILILLVLDLTALRSSPSLPIPLLAVAAAALAALWLAAGDYVAAPFPEQFVLDPGRAVAKAVLLGLALPVLLLAGESQSDRRFAMLLLSSLYGACLVVSAGSLVTLFLGLELLSLPVYALIVAGSGRPESAEAALKYLILGGAGSATLLFGISLTLGATGSLSMAAFAAAAVSPEPLAVAAVTLVLVGLMLKAALVPFHAWAPDAYAGTGIPVTAYMATVIKGAVLLALIGLFDGARLSPGVVGLTATLALLSAAWGNLAAMAQTGFRRMIAYSSIAHAGFLFFVLLGEPGGRQEAVVFYVLVYGLANLLAFACLPPHDDEATRDHLDRLRGLYRSRPAAAILIAVAMLSLAGIPPLPGFVAKFFIFKNVVEAGYTAWAVAGLLASYLGLFFYLRVIRIMFMDEPVATEAKAHTGVLAGIAGLVCVTAVAAVTLFPGWLLARL
ncbi:MAG: NADH-quinone oxidoreductase subunit N [Gammaproteobacteria bacterium]|nr:NADH-quinone oxidoreductase subunit N [Gammaproteobacteria bacterium]